jgi:hypothetical protein
MNTGLAAVNPVHKLNRCNYNGIGVMICNVTQHVLS